MKFTENQIRARRTLERRQDREAKALRAADTHKHPDCVVRADRTLIGCDHVEREQLKKHPDWHCYYDWPVTREDPEAFLAYGKVAHFRSTKNGGTFALYYERQAKNLDKFRIDLSPDDTLGQQLNEMSSILENATKPRFARLEIATDFGLGSIVDGPYVRRHFISGKCTPEGANAWGRRNGTKFIRSYFKKQIGAHRLEVQLNWRFLRKHHIDTIFDLPRLAVLLPRRHIWFARLDEQRVIERLRQTLSAKETLRILRRVNREPDLWSQLQVLRTEADLKNTRRLLVSLRTNQLVREAFKEWATQWPTSAPGLNDKS